MITKRVRGLSVLHSTAQAAAGAMLFWTWVFLYFHFFHPSTFYRERYLVYSLVVAVAFVLDWGRLKLAKFDLLHLDMIRVHALSLRQTTMICGTLIFFMVAAKDSAISRVFLFSFVPVLYVALFVSNRYLPGFLAEFVFRGKREERTILLGSHGNAAKLGP